MAQITKFDTISCQTWQLKFWRQELYANIIENSEQLPRSLLESWYFGLTLTGVLLSRQWTTKGLMDGVRQVFSLSKLSNHFIFCWIPIIQGHLLYRYFRLKNMSFEPCKSTDNCDTHFCQSNTMWRCIDLQCIIITWARSCENVSYAICEQQRRRSACASAQSDQRLCCSLLG